MKRLIMDNLADLVVEVRIRKVAELYPAVDNLLVVDHSCSL